MPGDPKECRMHAFRCIELASGARNPQLKSTFLELSANWQKLAGDLELTQRLLAQDTEPTVQSVAAGGAFQ
jgi:hypothetical protein